MSQTSRENWVLYEVTQGNIPGWMRTLVPITINKTINGTAHSLTYYVIPDYLSIGSDTDYFQEPMSPILAQRLANLLNCTLPTRLMVNQIWTNSAVKMTDNTFNPGEFYHQCSPVPVFILEDSANMVARFNDVTNTQPGSARWSAATKRTSSNPRSSTPNFANGASGGVTNVVVIYGFVIQPNRLAHSAELNAVTAGNLHGLQPRHPPRANGGDARRCNQHGHQYPWRSRAESAVERRGGDCQAVLHHR